MQSSSTILKLTGFSSTCIRSFKGFNLKTNKALSSRYLACHARRQRQFSRNHTCVATLLDQNSALLSMENRTSVISRNDSICSHISQENERGNSASIIFRQLFEHKSCTYTYLLACMKTHQAILIDPVVEMVPRDMKLIEQLGLTLKYAINTHVHADHITGSGKLKQLLNGSESVLGIDSGAQADIYLDQGQQLQIGDIKLEARKTPGHTNGCMTYVWHDQGRVFTGDAVLIRGCGRTDFQQGSPDRLYTSVHTQIFSLPDHYILYPAHDYTGQPWTTVGEEKVHNPRLSKSKSEFVELMNNLKLPYPKQIDRALPANLVCGIIDEQFAEKSLNG